MRPLLCHESGNALFLPSRKLHSRHPSRKVKFVNSSFVLQHYSGPIPSRFGQFCANNSGGKAQETAYAQALMLELQAEAELGRRTVTLEPEHCSANPIPPSPRTALV